MGEERKERVMRGELQPNITVCVPFFFFFSDTMAALSFTGKGIGRPGNVTTFSDQSERKLFTIIV